MEILIIGGQSAAAFLSQKFNTHQLTHLPAASQLNTSQLEGVSAVFDLEFDAHPNRLGLYATVPNCFFILHANAIQFAQVAASLGVRMPLFNVAGINAWPACIEAEPWEMSLGSEHAAEGLRALAHDLGFNYLTVADRVGMLTPRVIAMIINEAYYTLQEGTASKADIDLGMKLGTNYPYGPFEWAEKIGLPEVVRLLQAMYADTQDPRYKLCPLLKTESLAARW
ncbi:MAG: 3-hydroxyacyl-CoA dehydrogenase family protein [Bacteroidia bacterium]